MMLVDEYLNDLENMDADAALYKLYALFTRYMDLTAGAQPEI